MNEEGCAFVCAIFCAVAAILSGYATATGDNEVMPVVLVCACVVMLISGCVVGSRFG